MAKIRRFMDGGQVPPNQYPFANNPNNIQVGSQQEPLDTSLNFTQQYAKGGKVKKYADGGKAEYAIPDARARAAMREVENQKAMDRAYEEAVPRSMGTFKEKAPAPKPAASAPAKPTDKKMNCGGKVKGYAKGGMIDGIAQRGKTKCKIC